jgi:hypothetical protein
MTAPLPDLAAWYEANDAYLSAAIEWLRLLLAHHGPSIPRVIPTAPLPAPSPPPPPPSQEAPSTPWW